MEGEGKAFIRKEGEMKVDERPGGMEDEVVVVVLVLVVVVVEEPLMMAWPAGESWCTQPLSPHTWFAGAR